MATAQATKSCITLQGSAQIVSEYLECAVENILFLRGVFPDDYFTRKRLYELNVVTASDESLKKYLKANLATISSWIESNKVERLVLVLANSTNDETIERWEFDIKTDAQAEDDEDATSDKPLKEIQKEIQAVVRQITTSSTFLPIIEVPCSFDIILHTKQGLEMGNEWEISAPKTIDGAVEVKFKSFDTKLHRVETGVCYKPSEDL
ncbi:Mitotic spindle checkpoin protein MAD2 [Carpediemonas membranifera]|uniref:Mitotic spindle checkpoin protein MAD2 n=1 Tax=Carpediemonas membranifera TaxID=201153 RepID=A0A8J6AWD7_9EUKA|nr:Mitotic spindle checkpoin protein MAD2 [Carpediemonas membranifera]|eukprot:KAG9394175.1 Mitotic spindle checkpoin protein MAD2 [Carpediemonas membranifera]